MPDSINEIAKAPPHDLDLEKSLLGHAVLFESRFALQNLSDSDFYSAEHKTIFTALRSVQDDGDPLCLESIRNKLRYEFNCDSSVIFLLMDCMEAAAVNLDAARFTARKLLELSMSRQTMNQAYKTIAECRDGESITGVVTENLNAFQQIAARGISNNGMSETDAMLLFSNSILPGKGRKPIRTPWWKLNDLVGGWYDGEVTIIAARPRIGKTAMALNCLSLINQSSIPSIFFSLEMSTIDLMQRLMSTRTKIPLSRFRGENALFTNEESARIENESMNFCKTKTFFFDNPELTIDEIETIANQHKTQFGISIVFIDYLGLIAVDRHKNDSRQEQVARTSRGLKKMAKRLKVPVVCLAQINRQFDNRASGKPRLSELRGSGTIEQDADVVWLLSREVEDSDGSIVPVETQSEVTLTVAKNRNGRTGDVRMNWDGSVQTFAEEDTFAFKR